MNETLSPSPESPQINLQSEVKTVPIGPWEVNVASESVSIQPHLQQDAVRIVEEWQPHFPSEDTWVQTTLGVPSLIVRLDATESDGHLIPYEIEERPSGIGITSVINNSFRQNLDQARAQWPEFEVVVSPERGEVGTDDFLWAPIATPETAKNLVLLRAEPHENWAHPFQNRAVSTVLTKGDKSYGQDLGLWEKVTQPEQLDWNKPYTLKPMQGSKAKGVVIWYPRSQKEPTKNGHYKLPIWERSKRRGASTKTKILRVLEDNPQGMYRQEYISPLTTTINQQEMWSIFRIFLAFDLGTRSWKNIGGLWLARPNILIHGARDSVMGPLKLE